MTRNRITTEQRHLADLLLSIADTNHLVKDDGKQRYISLERKIGVTESNKLAVSIHRNYVGFMVRDGSSAARAKELNIVCERPESKNVLRFPKLSEADVHSHEAFFRDLLREASDESERRQQASGR